MTSNIGANIIKNQAGLGFASRDVEANYEKMRSNLMNEVNRFFRPEFLNRLDDVIVFKPLRKEDLVKILDIELRGIRARLAEKKIELELSAKAQEFLIENGTDLDMGARPLRRAVERFLEDALSEELLRGKFENCTRILAERSEDDADKKLCFTGVTAPAEVSSS